MIRPRKHRPSRTKNTPREFSRTGSHHVRQSCQDNPIECRYCGKFGHYEEECRKKKWVSASPSRQLMNNATNCDYEDHYKLFIMRYKAHSMSTSSPTNTSPLDNVRFVDPRASNHVTSHKVWFWELWKPDRVDYVETRDDTIHPLQHIGNIRFDNDGKQTYIKNVLHVTPVKKNPVSVSQIVEQGKHVRFNHEEKVEHSS